MFAGKYKLAQLIVFVDRNNIQIDGPTEDVMPLENLREKWESFGWHVQEIDGNNVRAVIDAVNFAKAVENHYAHNSRQGRRFHGIRLHVARYRAK